jgi:dipeptidyl aminopeptidase/acylaminoacyl peptidase
VADVGEHEPLVGPLGARIGSFRLGPERVVFVGYVLGSITPAAFDFATGRLYGFAVRPDGTLTAGPRLRVHEPAELTVAWNGDGTLRWHEHGARPATALPVPLRAEEARFANGDVALAGTLLLPPGAGPHPACVIVHGSGGQWRDCVRLIADFLAGSGVAALAYDKRGTGASTGDYDRADFPDLAEDALAGMRFLQAHPAVDARRVGFFGSSQGGWIVPIAASRAPDTAFAILHSAPAVPVWRQNLNNVEHSMRADGFGEETIGRALAMMDGLQDMWRTGEGWEGLAAAWRAAEGEPWLEYVGPLPEKPTPEQAERWRRNTDRELDRDPLPFLERTRCPVLALYGSEDTVVAPEANAELLAGALRRGGNADVELRVFEHADHLGVVRREGGRRLAFGDATHFEVGYFREMAAWLRSRQ